MTSRQPGAPVHDHDHGLAHDLEMILRQTQERRRVLAWLSGLGGAAVLAACGGGGSDSSGSLSAQSPPPLHPPASPIRRRPQATDFWPSFEACSSGISDPDYCARNAEPDAMTIVGGSRVWVDHCEFTDGPELQGAQAEKSRYKYYDGLLDIKSGADYVTVSYSRFYNHHKAMLIGATDSNDGDYRITFHHNHIQWVNQRMPRVRNGQVHILNNVYAGPRQADHTQQYYFGYGIGLGYDSKVYSERNAFDIPDAAASHLLSASFGKWAQYFTDAGSWLNGAAVDLNAVAKSLIDARNNGGSTPFIGPVTWSPAASYRYTADTSVDALRTKVAASAGIGKVTPVPSPYAVSP